MVFSVFGITLILWNFRCSGQTPMNNPPRTWNAQAPTIHDRC
jgi:hypothetical protein